MSDYVQGALDALSKAEENYIKNDEASIYETAKKILDSGNRRQFESGAVRDIQEGKGRCDLLPLTEIADFINYYSKDCDLETRKYKDSICFILVKLDSFVHNGNSDNIYEAIMKFMDIRGWTTIDAILEVSKHFEAGAKKYEERNLEKGIPLHSFVDSGIRHLLKWANKMEDEPHDRAFLWNMFCLLWTMKNHPECNDLPFKDTRSEVIKKRNECINCGKSISSLNPYGLCADCIPIFKERRLI